MAICHESSCHSLCWMSLVVSHASSLSFSALCLPPFYPLRSPLPFKFLQMFLPIGWGSPAQSYPLAFITSCPEAVPEPWENSCLWRTWKPAWGQAQSVPGFTCTGTEKTDSLCYMQITYAHACTRSLSRQVITCRKEWGFISVPVEGGSEHPWALEGFNNSS